MKTRQRGAIGHPISNDNLSVVPHKSRVAQVRNRRTILTVSEFLPRVWVWQASLSYQEPNGSGAIPLSAWTEKQTAKGKRELISLLDGVGVKIVFAVAPSGESDLWNDMGLEQWDVISDQDAWAHVDESLGYNLPCPPGQFRAMHMWKPLTDTELVMVNTTLGRMDD